jgi:glycosyltransferase involved in cell wall biosynthesis
MATETPFISVAMMVKNEEEFLAEALKSAQAWADEIIVVDTGSTDKTVEIAKSFGATVTYFEWCDSFAAARNETLRVAKGEWIIILDADERLRGENPESLRTFLKSRSTSYPFEVVTLNVVNTKLDGEVISELDNIRIIPNDKRLGYANRVHHVFGSLDPNFPNISRHAYKDLEIVHLGYDPEVYASRKKGERSLPLIERTVKENPSDALYRYYLGREYYSLKRFDEAITTLKESEKLILAKKDHSKDLRFDIAWFLLQAMRANKHDFADTLQTAHSALEDLPSKPDLWFMTGHILSDAGEKKEAITSFERAIALLDSDLSEAFGINHIETRRAEILKNIGALSAENGDMERAYGAFIQGLEHVAAENLDLRLELVNCACGLAIDLGDTQNLPVLMELLLQIKDAPLEMFFLGLDAIAKEGDRATALSFIKDAKVAYPHLAEHPQSIVWSIEF